MGHSKTITFDQARIEGVKKTKTVEYFATRDLSRRLLSNLLSNKI